MTTVNLTPTIPLLTRRCYDCRRWFAHESDGPTNCPSCATELALDRWNQLEKQKRTIAALRGALKRKGRKR